MFGSGLVSVSLFLFATTGVSGFTVTTNNANVQVKENEGVDLMCTHSADFGSTARVEWKFTDLKDSQTYVIFDGKPTESYSSRVTMFGSNVRFRTVTRKDNGVYDCEVSGNNQFGEVKVKLTVLVPPSPPLCRIPPSVTTGKTALLSCSDDPSKITGFKNSTYKLNPVNGNLEFPQVNKMDAGAYYCEASNIAGPPKSCKAMQMEVRDLNIGGIVAGILIALLLLALLGFGIWYANKKGYLPQKTESKLKPTAALYQPTTSVYGGGNEEAGDFRQKSSFLV
ncbi:hypothetical protein LDENG_00066850 [Lucifuga dentata]|nr:hypothetical protein LDENG_00066850 [Lucifuga dentata]